MTKILPVILAGGKGSRLWPLSRDTKPKQFINIEEKLSLFQGTVQRVNNSFLLEPLIITAVDYKFFVVNQLQELGVSATILLEPSGKNTAPAIFAACLISQTIQNADLLLVMPSDHWIDDNDDFKKSVLKAIEPALSSKIVLFGVQPTFPETGYGYIKYTESDGEVFKNVEKFVEKPKKNVAERMLKDGNYYWNSGIFLFAPNLMLSLAKTLEPQLLSGVTKATEKIKKNRFSFLLDKKLWNGLKEKSIDYAIMERASNIVCMPMRSEWSDVGNWLSITKFHNRDEQNNLVKGNALLRDSKNTVLWSNTERLALSGLGLDGIFAVATDDAILITKPNELQNISHLVQDLKKNKVSQAKQSLRVFRAWGWFESLFLTSFCQVKRLHVSPNSCLSLQSHKFRAEHWVVVDGVATVWLDEKIITLKTNSSVYIEKGQKHRLCNESDEPLVVIEVQTGTYFGEDDITRY